MTFCNGYEPKMKVILKVEDNILYMRLLKLPHGFGRPCQFDTSTWRVMYNHTVSISKEYRVIELPYGDEWHKDKNKFFHWSHEEFENRGDAIKAALEIKKALEEVAEKECKPITIPISYKCYSSFRIVKLIINEQCELPEGYYFEVQDNYPLCKRMIIQVASTPMLLPDRIILATNDSYSMETVLDSSDEALIYSEKVKNALGCWMGNFKDESPKISISFLIDGRRF